MPTEKQCTNLVHEEDVVYTRPSTIFKIGCEPLVNVPVNIAMETSSFASVALTRMGMRGMAYGLDSKKDKLLIKEIKDIADGFAKLIYERVITRSDKTVWVRVSEGLGRDDVLESFTANEVVNPEGKGGTENAIVDVIEGTNAMVSNINNKALDGLEDWESGATSVIVTGAGVASLGNCPDYYVDGIFTLIPKDKRQGFIDTPLDTEISNQDITKLETALQRIAEANNIPVDYLEVVLMDRAREAQRTSALYTIKEKYPGLRITPIKDGTVAHGLLATFGKRKGKHKVLMTVGGTPEGFLNLAIAGLFKDHGAVGSVRIVSKEVNKRNDGSPADNLDRRYDFNQEEIDNITKLRPVDAAEILRGKKLFTQEDVKGDVEGCFSFITNNGVFRVRGAEEQPDGSYRTKILRVGNVDGDVCVWFEEKIYSLEEINNTVSRIRV
jgi:fructose-1,6-bisphosphatase/sedoheptulose 1,7-bisphosphatase-like protein